MTPLSDALTAAQRRALAALEKAYVAGQIDADDLAEKLTDCGIRDTVDIEYLASTLDVLREWGAPVPAETNGAPKEEPMSDKQRTFIGSLLEEKGVSPDDFPDTTGLTKTQASDLINELQAGKYDPAKWRVPF